MNLRELIDEFRSKSGDDTPFFQWSDDEITAYANAAQREAARRALLLMDIGTSDICNYNVAANNPMIVLDPRIILVRRIRLDNQQAPLAIKSWREVEEMTPGWDVATGSPKVAIPDLQTECLRLSPTPTEPTVARMAVFRLPLADMVIDSDTPEINPSMHLSLVSGMLAQAYQKNDSETLRPESAAFHASQFEAVFGPPTSAINEIGLARTATRSRYEEQK